MKIKGVDFVFYNVTDFARSKKFYEETLELKMTMDFSPSWGEFDTGTLALAIGVHGGTQLAETQNGNVAVALAVDDVKAGVEALRAKGVRIKTEPQEFDPCFMAIIADPDGNDIILHQRKNGTVG
jgi:predicted enzyme related to lactoylglutathione lyase